MRRPKQGGESFLGGGEVALVDFVPGGRDFTD
jgi:hypothetical protein